MELRKIRIGILGTASIAQRYVIPTLLGMPDLFELKGIASRSIDRAQELADKYSVASYSPYESMLDDNDLDAVYIPLPNALHYEWIENSLQRGLHILVEKSLACSSSEVIKLSKLADDNRLALIENFQFRFHSQLQRVIDIMESGEIGELRCMRSSFGFPPFPDRGNIRYSKLLGGGALLDAGAYPIKLSQIMLGENINVLCASLSYNSEHDVDIWGSGTLIDIETGIHSQISFGFDNYYQCSLELWGSKGRLFTNRIFTAPPNVIPQIELSSGGNTEILNIEADNHFEKMLKYFHAACQGKISESKQNIKQSRMIEEFRNKAHE
ncbi:MAG: Gfo/Idh/MocA family oxidoreductase [Gammaproteobacteria bacterium]